MQVDNLRASKSSKNPILRDSLKSLIQKVTKLQKELKDNDKKHFNNKKESFMDIHTIHPFHIPELVSLSQMKVY